MPRDGETMGEVVMRGNNVMKGYYRRPRRHRGGVRAAAGSTRAIWPCGTPTATSSCGTARRTSSSPAARTSRPSRSSRRSSATPPCSSRRWSPSPTRSGASDRRRSSVLKPGGIGDAGRADRARAGRIARFKAPDSVEILEELPKTSTGKIQKFVLRERSGAAATPAGSTSARLPSGRCYIVIP